MAGSLVRERRAVVRALWAGVLVSFSTVGLAGTSAWLIVRAAQRPAVLALSVPMGLVQLFALAKAAGRYLERTQTHRAALSIMGHVRAHLAVTLERLVPAGLGPRSADAVDLVVRDVERVQDLLSAVAGPLVTSTLAGAATVVVSGLVAPWTALSLSLALLVSLALPALGACWGERSERELDDARALMVRLVEHAVHGGDEYVMNAMAPSLEGRLAVLETRVDRARRRAARVRGSLGAAATVTSAGSAIVALWLSAAAPARGSIGVALLAVPVLLSVAALEMMGSLAPGLVGLRGDRAALSRLESLSALASPVREPELPDEVPEGDPHLRATALWHHYDETQVPRDVWIDLAPGDRVSLRGASGAGKSTLANLVARFIDPTLGELALSQRPYPLLGSERVREYVGLCDDEPYVFATTLAGNLRIARARASDDELLEVCRLVGLDSLLATLPEGLGTALSRHSVLSGGERRRLGVARELLARRPVVVFDEPTEGLDEASAVELLETLGRVYHDTVMIIVSHRELESDVVTHHWELAQGRLYELAR